MEDLSFWVHPLVSSTSSTHDFVCFLSVSHFLFLSLSFSLHHSRSLLMAFLQYLFNLPTYCMHNAKMFMGQPSRFALWELVPTRYITFPHDHFGRDNNRPTMLRNKTSTAEDRS